jgi:four helix bundle protein
MKRFEDSIAWQKSQELVVTLYQTFRGLRDFAFRDQIQRAAVSVPTNIAEGFERGTEPELRRFLFIAKGSNAEVRSLLYTAKSLEYIDETKFHELNGKSSEISRIVQGFINKLRR